MSDFPTPLTTIDIVLLTIRDSALCIVLAPRRSDPFKGKPALIGGYVHVDEDGSAEETAARVLADKAGLDGVYLEQLQTFSGAARDPRGWSVSIVYLALVPHELVAKSKTKIKVVPVAKATGLPFDHDEIVSVAIHRLRGKGSYSTLPARLLAREFSLPEMHKTYEIVRGEEIDPASFRRKMIELGAIIEAPEAKAHTLPSRRPSKMFKLAEGTGLFDRKI